MVIYQRLGRDPFKWLFIHVKVDCYVFLLLVLYLYTRTVISILVQHVRVLLAGCGYLETCSFFFCNGIPWFIFDSFYLYVLLTLCIYNADENLFVTNFLIDEILRSSGG